MKNKLIVFSRYILIFVFIFLSLYVFLNPKKTETNLLRAIIPSDNKENDILVELSKKYSSNFNVTFEADDRYIIKKVSDEFLSSLDKKVFVNDSFNINALGAFLDIYKKHHNYLLSNETRFDIKNNDFKNISNKALYRLYQPLGLNFVSIEEDPFLLFDDYLMSLQNYNLSGEKEYEGKFYKYYQLKVNDEIALSPVLLNKEISKLIKIKDELINNNKGVQIYLTGTPVHTYYASSKSMNEINIICVLSSLFIIFIARFYFKSYKILVPIALSLIFGTLSGYYLCSLIFNSIHILTFVFSTTLIGICVDYSLHFFAGGLNIEKIFKSLTVGMLTTISAFLILLFSKIELLAQIAIFTSAGLIFVYLFVILFHPLISKMLNLKTFDVFDIDKLNIIKLNKITKKIIIILIVFVSISGVLKIKFSDDISNMYIHDKELLKAEKIYSMVSDNNINTKFIPVKGKNLQEILENEEKITDNLPDDEFYSISKFLPSIKKQRENFNLRKNLYKNELKNYATFLNDNYKNELLNLIDDKNYLSADELKILKDGFIFDDNTSVIVLKNADISKIKNQKIIDLKEDISNFVKNCRINCLKLIIPILSVLFLVLSVIYGIKGSIKIIFPSFLGGLFALGILGIFNIEVNMFHILSLFLIMGFSLDYSVFRYNNKENSKEMYASVLISCITSVFSFLLLSMTSFKLISSLGFILSVGLMSSYIFSILLIEKYEK